MVGKSRFGTSSMNWWVRPEGRPRGFFFGASWGFRLSVNGSGHFCQTKVRIVSRIDRRARHGYFVSMTRKFSPLEAVETGVAMAMAGPFISAAAPVINGITDGGSLSGILPEGIVQKGKDAIASITQGDVGSKLGSRVNDLVSNLRGGLLGQNIPSAGGFNMDGAGLGANLFPDGLKLPGGHALEQGFNRIKQDVGRLL